LTPVKSKWTLRSLGEVGGEGGGGAAAGGGGGGGVPVGLVDVVVMGVEHMGHFSWT